MRKFATTAVLLAGFCIWAPPFAAASFHSGSTGADGALDVTQNTELQLPPDGVFNFTTVTVASGATLTFKKNEQNTPVTILATGDVVIQGTVDIRGKNGNYLIPGAGGPTAFEGGVGGSMLQIGRRGEGPGGGFGGSPKTSGNTGGGTGGGGGFSTSGATGGTGATSNTATPGAGGIAYGNERIIPLIGGSGGGGGGGTTEHVGGSGGGGGGGIVIASSGNITVTGSILANGGNGANGEHYLTSTSYRGGGGGGGAGGSIRLIANVIGGDGAITATGGLGGYGYYAARGGTGAKGRIRFEASSITRTTATDPPLSMGYPYAVTPPNMPTLRIASIGGIPFPSVPQGSFGRPDVTLPYDVSNPVNLIIQAGNIPVGTQVTVRSNPAVGATTTGTGMLSGSLEASSATVDIDISTAWPSVLTASVTYELVALGGPFFLDGELVARVRVESTVGGGSALTYITEKGREISVPM
jgi:hypothetical protein